MTSLVDIEETVLRRFSSLTFGKNKISDKSTEVRAASEPPKILSSNGNLLDQEISTSSQHFEAIIVTFVKISYFLGIAPYQTKIIELHNEKVVESSSSRLHMVQVVLFIICIGLLLITSLYRTIVESGKHMEEFCKHNRYGQQIICNNGKHKHLKILALQILYVLGNTMARNTRRLPRLEFLIIALTLWQLCKSFSRSIRRRNEYHALYQNHEVMLILSAYEELKEISNLICILIGETLVSEIVEDIVYFSLEVQLSIRSADWFGVLVIFETWITAFLAYFIAANAAEHVR
ncbi:unnamed protein product [Orchesella dallaii]|uniref:Gustatory receptor n=1 Tax=Orchesella dallaii TaxID=48710 RepID=A0ABP1QUC9_9HEXA